MAICQGEEPLAGHPSFVVDGQSGHDVVEPSADEVLIGGECILETVCLASERLDDREGFTHEIRRAPSSAEFTEHGHR